MRALPDDGDPDVSLDELLMTVAQLRDMPAAERSAVVPEEDQRDGLLGPQSGKVSRRPVEGEDLGVGSALSNRWAYLGMHPGERIGPKGPERIGVRADTL